MFRCPPREQYKIELRIRNHSTFTRQNLIEAVADSVPKQLKVDLEAPEVFVLMEVFKVRHQFTIWLGPDLIFPTASLSLTAKNWWDVEHLWRERSARLLQTQEV